MTDRSKGSPSAFGGLLGARRQRVPFKKAICGRGGRRQAGGGSRSIASSAASIYQIVARIERMDGLIEAQSACAEKYSSIGEMSAATKPAADIIERAGWHDRGLIQVAYDGTAKIPDVAGLAD